MDFTYDRNFLRKSIEECRQLLQTIIERHSTDKTKGRVDTVFQTFCEPDLLDAIFTNETYKPFVEPIIKDLGTLMDENKF